MRGLEVWLRRTFQTLRRAVRAVPILRSVRPKTKRRFLRAIMNLAVPLLRRGGHPLQVTEDLRLYLPPELIRTYVLQEYEPATRRLLESLLSPGAVMIDVGANVGFFSVLAARRVGPGGKIYAVEPGPDNLEYLRRNLELHGTDQVEVLAAAAGPESGKRMFHLHRVGTVHSFYPADHSVRHEVRQIALDDVVSPPVKLIKIDVEGEELGVLAGMERLLRDSPGLHLIIEWTPSRLAQAGHPPEALPRRLRELGFQLRPICDDSLDVNTVETALEALHRGRLPKSWGVNLLAEPKQGASS